LKLEVIIAPLVVFMVMVALLVTARFYEHLPMKLPPCSFKRATGIPCLACRGTRALRALASGKVWQAVKYNPLAVMGCLISLLWLGGYVLRRGRAPRWQVPVKWVMWITIVLLMGNWIFLILTDHWFL
jgi:Protein of unknown function (DUF2752)